MVREDGSQPRDVIIAQRVRGYDISPDGRTVAVIAQDENKPRLKIVDIATGAARLVVDADKTFVGSVTWSVDGQALAVMRRDILPDGSFGVPRLWLMRPTGDFVGQLDPEGKPALAPVWSPDQQRIAYISPATGELIVRNLTTQEGQVLGNPRGGQPAWSVDSKLVVFESIPAGAQTGTLPPQPIHIEALDGSTKRDIGVPGEIRGNPVFLDAATVLSVRRLVGDPQAPSDLYFESVVDGRLVRTLRLSDHEYVYDLSLDPARRQALYTAGDTETSVYRLDLTTGERQLVAAAAQRPRWLP